MLVDGEHHPSVVRAALRDLLAASYELVGAVAVGEGDKIGPGGWPELGLDVVTGTTPLVAFLAGLARFAPRHVVDLADEPVLDARTRERLVAHALARGIEYRGADFVFTPPPRPRLATKPSIAVIGTGKRTGKTAIAAAAARALVARGTPPVIVTMGRGGPDPAELVDPLVYDLSPAGLVRLADTGRHAASDHLEDAVTARVVTVGTRRCGGGLAGAPASSTFADGLALADERPEPLLLLEGSGRTIPPVAADATICVAAGGTAPDLARTYLGATALLLSDLVVVTLTDVPSEPSHLGGARAPTGSRSSVQANVEAPAHPLESLIREIVPGVPILNVGLRPWPLGPIAGRSVVFATTAPEPTAARQAAHLESQHRAEMIGPALHLAGRSRLTAAIAAAADRGAEVLVTELKAAGVDVATRAALEAGMEVVYCDNRPETVSVQGRAPASLDDMVAALAEVAAERFRAQAIT